MGLFKGKIKQILVIVVGFFLTSCFDSSTEIIDGNYVVERWDIDANTCLSYQLPSGSSIGRVEGRVVNLGWNNDFFIVERIPRGLKTSEFFIIDRRLDGPYVDPSVTVFGPFMKKDFSKERKEIGVPASVKFTKFVK